MPPDDAMIPNHSEFLDALARTTKVRVRFYSRPDGGVVDRICAPIDYGPGAGSDDGLHRYWLWDDSGESAENPVGLLPAQIVELRVLGESFDPARIGPDPWPWAVPREWKRSGATPPPGKPTADIPR